MTPSDPRPLAEVYHETPNLNELSGVCPHCGTLAGFFLMIHENLPGVVFPGITKLRFAEIARCRSCNGLVFGLVLGDIVHGLLLWPEEVWPDRAPGGLDDGIRRSYDEARKIIALSPSGAATLARRCLQAVLRTKLGIKKRRLFAEIEEAQKHEDLTRPTRSALHHIREIGNWAAHPEVDEASTITEVTPEQARYTLQAVELVFHDLYVVPDRVQQMGHLIAEQKGDS